MRRSPFLLLAFTMVMHQAGAGECRARLRPLVLQADPPAAELQAVRAVCATEADAGDAEAKYQLSFFYLGLGGNWSPAEAVPLIQTAADGGVPEAQYWLAWQSESGPQMPHDVAVARGWYEKAAASRHRLALQRLAEAYDRGELGLPVDARKAAALRAQIRRCEDKLRK